MLTKYKVLEAACTHFDGDGTGRIHLNQLSEALDSFKLGVPMQKAMTLAQKHAGSDGKVRYASYVRDLHGHERYDGSHSTVHGSHGLHHHAHHASKPNDEVSHYQMSHELLRKYPREHPGRSAAAAAAAAVDHSLNRAYVHSDRPKIHELLAT